MLGLGVLYVMDFLPSTSYFSFFIIFFGFFKRNHQIFWSARIKRMFLEMYFIVVFMFMPFLCNNILGWTEFGRIQKNHFWRENFGNSWSPTVISTWLALLAPLIEKFAPHPVLEKLGVPSSAQLQKTQLQEDTPQGNEIQKQLVWWYSALSIWHPLKENDEKILKSAQVQSTQHPRGENIKRETKKKYYLNIVLRSFFFNS